MDLYARYHRFIFYDAFTGILSECVGSRSKSVIYGANCTKLEKAGNSAADVSPSARTEYEGVIRALG